ncbi:MAG: hypothetical protein E7632_01195 [Ruminococcaceae bacterium]|nr:hypothetical protein [Oscillospiraceae bacterium]
MTSQSSIINKRAGTLPLLRFSLKQFWTTILLFGIILFFLLPVPVLMMASDADNYNLASSMAYDVTARRLRQFTSWSENIRMAIVPIVSILGVVVSCARFGYLKNKVSVDFYHSLPIRRGKLYLTQIAVGAMSLAIPFTLNLLISMLVVAVNGCLTGEIFVNLLILTLEVIVYTAFFSGLATLVGMVSGLSAVHLILTAVAIFIVPVIYLLCVAFVSLFSENMWLDWFIRGDLIMKLTPVFRFLGDINNPISLAGGILLVIFAALMFGGAYFVYLHRKSERAGTPVVFGTLGEVIKYLMVFIGTLGGGLLFYLIMESRFWMIFGMICGTVLVFMLTNTILQKTAKAMLRGWKTLLAYSLVIAIAFVGLSVNLFGVNTDVPSPALTAKVELNLPDAIEGMEFRSDEAIEAIYNIYKKGDFEYKNLPSPIWNYESVALRVVFYPKIGLPVAKSVRIYNKSELMEEFRTLLDCEEFEEQYLAAIDRVTKESGQLFRSTNEYYFDTARGKVYRFYNGDYYSKFDRLSLDSPAAKAVGLDTLREESADVSFDFFQQQVFSGVSIYTDRSLRDVNLAIFNSMEKTISSRIENNLAFYTPDELIDAMAACVKYVTVYKLISTDGEAEAALTVMDGGEVVVTDDVTVAERNLLSAVIRDKKQIKEILAASISPHGHSYAAPFTFADTQYFAKIEWNISEIYNFDYSDPAKLSPEVLANVVVDNSYDDSLNQSFFAGKVPACVIGAFN